jgi:hypothetical protein
MSPNESLALLQLYSARCAMSKKCKRKRDVKGRGEEEIKKGRRPKVPAGPSQ